jgi:hypothetical protein
MIRLLPYRTVDLNTSLFPSSDHTRAVTATAIASGLKAVTIQEDWVPLDGFGNTLPVTDAGRFAFAFSSLRFGSDRSRPSAFLLANREGRLRASREHTAIEAHGRRRQVGASWVWDRG